MKKEKLITIIFKTSIKESVVSMLIDFLKGLIGNYIEPFFKENVLSVLIHSECDIDFQGIIQSLNEDFYVPSTLFESSELFVEKDEYLAFVYANKKALLETNKLYLVESDLIKLKFISDTLCKNILKGFYEDFEMRKIIKTYLEYNMNISKAADELYMHRNTLMYKIDNFIKITGYDIKKFKHAFIIYHII